MTDRRERLAAARIYLICPDQDDGFLEAALRGGVDIVQLRMKNANAAAVAQAGKRFRRITSRHGALLMINDRPDLVQELDADGAHVGQEDMPVAQARQIVGADRLLGLSTHTEAQVDSVRHADVDYIGVGPVYETPTKAGRPAVGLELVRYAARRARIPFFAIGGISPANLAAVRQAGARRIAVVRALTSANDPEQVARQMRHLLLEPREETVGAT
ncbi:MAG TPA: thiamine phosphate synthase [Solirubrobacteraceae bacterium]|nr:thiamine phosphate synthase [Solirubrobacteraceae bacterium]